MVSRRTVLLYSPHFVAPKHRSGATYRATPPLSHLALAGPLREAGYQVQIVDAKWDTDWRSLVRQNHDRLLCAGITSLTGPAVSDGLEFATFTKQLRPDLPLIWGGWHASFAAQQAMEDRGSILSCAGWASGPLLKLCRQSKPAAHSRAFAEFTIVTEERLRRHRTVTWKTSTTFHLQPMI